MAGGKKKQLLSMRDKDRYEEACAWFVTLLKGLNDGTITLDQVKEEVNHKKPLPSADRVYPV